MKTQKIYSEESKNVIVKLLQEQKERPLNETQIAEKLVLRGGARKRLRKLLNAMVREGAIVCLHQNHFGIGEPDDLVTGELEMRRSGDGIVVSKDGAFEIFVPEEDLSIALPHDLVVVRLIPGSQTKGGKKYRLGKIIRVLERSLRDIVGTLRATAKFYYVVPIDPVYGRDFYVPDPKGARVNDRVVIRFTSWANRHVNPEAEVMEILGPENNPTRDTLAIIRQYALPDKFSADVLREAERAVKMQEQAGARRDLRDKDIFTIDPATARDYDDAISLETNADGHRILGVHIADVSHFVRPHSALDAEARCRGNSVYFPDTVLPMLPETISNGACSLRPNEDKCAFSVMMVFNREGIPVKTDFCRSIIRSRLRLTYEQAYAVLKSDAEQSRVIGQKACRLLRQCHELAQQLRQRRFAQCALNLDMPEYEIFIGRHGLIEDIRQTLSDISHQLIEEFMIAANEAVDRALSERGFDIIRRVHEPPEPEKIEALAVRLYELGFHPGDLSKRKNMTAFLESINGHPFEYDAKLAVLKSMKRALYAPESLGHYGLAKKYYAHFTSPIRRYPDLLVHRALGAMLEGRMNPYKHAELKALGRHCSQTEQMADLAEKALIEIKKYRFLEQQVKGHKPLETHGKPSETRAKPEHFDAVVVNVKNFGMFVELTKLQIQGLVHISSISKEFVRFDASRGELRTQRRKYRMGDRVKVAVVRVDFDKREIDFILIDDQRTHCC